MHLLSSSSLEPHPSAAVTVFVSLLFIKSPILSHCDSVGFSADFSFCKPISKIPFYIQNKFPVVSPLRGTPLFFISLQGSSSFFFGSEANTPSSTFQRALIHISELLLKHIPFTLRSFTQGCQEYLTTVAFRSYSYILPL